MKGTCRGVKWGWSGWGARVLCVGCAAPALRGVKEFLQQLPQLCQGAEVFRKTLESAVQASRGGTEDQSRDTRLPEGLSSSPDVLQHFTVATSSLSG